MPATQPNILMILTDQLSAQALSAYGNCFGRTPHLDRLAARGAVFEQCVTACPLCQRTRASFWTGRWPHETGVRSNGRKDVVAPYEAGTPTVGTLFAGAGYTTRHFGKRHDAGRLAGFACEPEAELPVDGSDAWPVHYDTRRDRYTTTKAVEFLQTHGAEPYLAVVDLQNPHDICNWIGSFQGTHDDVTGPGGLPPLPENFCRVNFDDLPRSVQYICCAHNRQSQVAEWTEANWRHYLAAYHHYIERVDGEIGLILEALAARADGAETCILFAADHGDSMGGRGLATKHTSFYRETTWVPLFLSGPGIAPGRRVGGLSSTLDWMPTLCDWAGLIPPKDLWGVSLLPWARGETDEAIHEYVVSEWHTEWGFTVEPGRLYRTPRYSYMCYREDEGTEFYDLEVDPGETHSRVADPACAPALQTHRDGLARHVAATGDDFFSLAAAIAPRWRSHPPGYHHHRGPTAAQVETA